MDFRAPRQAAEQADDDGPGGDIGEDRGARALRIGNHSYQWPRAERFRRFVLFATASEKETGPAQFNNALTGDPFQNGFAVLLLSTIEKRQGFRIACPEEIAFNQKFIDRDQMEQLGQVLGKSDYAKYVQMLAKEP